MDTTALWDKCTAFHGHTCGGLAVGFRAALYAAELLKLDFSRDEEIVCVTENDACGVDAIQVLLGCSAGKGNLVFRMRGKQAYSFYNRKNGESLRLVLRDRPPLKPGESGYERTLAQPAAELFDVKPAAASPPVTARIFASHKCDACGETTAENMLRLDGDKKLCLDCYTPYSRFG